MIKPMVFNEQKGATLVELLVAAGISVIVVGVITGSLAQFILVSRWGNDQLLVTNSLQTASLWLGRDVLESHAFTAGSGNEYGTLSWEDGSQQFRYSYDAGNQTLIREHLIGGVVQSSQTAARRIEDQSDITFTLNGDLLSISLTVTSGDVSETRQLDLAMRSR